MWFYTYRAIAPFYSNDLDTGTLNNSSFDYRGKNRDALLINFMRYDVDR